MYGADPGTPMQGEDMALFKVGPFAFCIIRATDEGWLARLTISVRALCLPVFIVDPQTRLHLPFPHLIDWTRISTKWPASHVKDLQPHLMAQNSSLLEHSHNHLAEACVPTRKLTCMHACNMQRMYSAPACFHHTLPCQLPGILFGSWRCNVVDDREWEQVACWFDWTPYRDCSAVSGTLSWLMQKAKSVQKHSPTTFWKLNSGPLDRRLQPMKQWQAPFAVEHVFQPMPRSCEGCVYTPDAQVSCWQEEAYMHCKCATYRYRALHRCYKSGKLQEMQNAGKQHINSMSAQPCLKSVAVNSGLQTCYLDRFELYHIL
jgi:hypothetical protein